MPPVLSRIAEGDRPILLLPALSSISTREEMLPLASELGATFVTEVVDWPGFGIGARPVTNWTPDILSDFLRDSVDRLNPKAIIAAGHSAAYAVHLLSTVPNQVDCLILTAPTWRGPLPTMMGGHKPWFSRIVAALDSPFVGQALYRLNVSRWVIRRMAREHVYSDPAWLNGARFQSKIAVTKGKGARHSSVRFVTGRLDRYTDGGQFLDDLARVKCPILVLYGDNTPRRSRAKMDGMALLPNVTAKVLKRGKLAIHEEFAPEIASEIMQFLRVGKPT